MPPYVKMIGTAIRGSQDFNTLSVCQCQLDKHILQLYLTDHS